MILTFDVTRLDLIRSDWLLVTRAPQMAFLRWLPFVALIVPTLSLMPLSGEGCECVEHTFWDWLIAFGLGTVPTLLLLLLGALSTLGERKGAGTVGRHTVTVTPEGWTDTTAAGDVQRAWLDVDDLQTFSALVYLRIGLTRMVIPRQAFGSGAEAEARIQTFRAYWHQAAGPHAMDIFLRPRSGAR